MADSRVMWAEYCDDVRQEIGNKISLIGCYGSDILISAFPTFLPKLCVVVKVRTPVDQPFDKGVVRLYRDDQPIAEMAIDTNAPGVPQLDIRPGTQWRILQVVIAMSPFAVEAPCILRAAFETAGEEISAPRLFIREGTGQPATVN